MLWVRLTRFRREERTGAGLKHYWLVAATLAAAAMMSGGLATEASARPRASHTTIQLWYNGSLTGATADLGQNSCNGEKLAVQDINRHGGIRRGPERGARMRVQCIDTGNLSTTAASIAAKYVSNPSIWMLSGYTASGNALAAAKVVAPAHLAIQGDVVAAPFLTRQAKNVFVMNPTLGAAGAAAVDFCHSYYGAHKIAGLNPDYSYIAGYMAGASAAARAAHLRIVSQQLWPDPSTTDFSPYLTKTKASGAQCVLLGAYPPEECEVTRQARQLGLAQPMIDLTESFTTPSCQKEAGKYYEGMIFGNLMPATLKRGSFTARVAAEYKKRFGATMTYASAQAYDAVLAVEYALEDGARNRTQLESYLAKVSGPGVGGPVKFQNRRIGQRFLTFLEATKSGALQPVAEYKVFPNNSVRLTMLAKCSRRASCQTRLKAKA